MSLPTAPAGDAERVETGGKLLADRSLSRLLKGDWAKTIDEAEDQLRLPGV